MNQQINEVYYDYLYDKSPVLVLKGGAGSGKSFFVSQKLVRRCMEETPCKILALRKVGATVKNSVLSQISVAIDEINGWNEWTLNKTDRVFTHDSGSRIILNGMDDPEKIKSIEGITSVWMEEATEFSEKDFNQIQLRLRNPEANYLQIVLSFNPISEDHWIKKRFFDKSEEGVHILETTYHDNPTLPAEYVAGLESLKTKDKEYYDIYCLGLWGIVDTSNKFARRFDESVNVGSVVYNPDEPVFLSFDFNVDPITCIAGQHTSWNDIRIFKEFRIRNSDIYELCEHIKQDLRTNNIYITGDATGRGRQAISRGNVTYYQVIESDLMLSPYQIEVPKSNPHVSTTRTLLNALLGAGNITIDQSCEYLINDLKYVKWKNNKIEKAEDSSLTHLLDTIRYYCYTWHKDFLIFK